MPLALSCGEKNWGVWSVTPQLHVHFWLKRLNSTASTCNIIEKVAGAGPVNGWKLYIAGAANLICFEVWGATGAHVFAGAAWTPTDGKWYVIDATFDGRYAKLFVDDSEVGSGDMGEVDELAAEASAILISTAINYPGEIEGLAIFNEPLPAAQRAILYNAGRRIGLGSIRAIRGSAYLLEALLDLNFDDRDYGPHQRNVNFISSLTYGGGPYTYTLGNGGGAGAGYGPPIFTGDRQQLCSHQDLAETIGH